MSGPIFECKGCGDRLQPSDEVRAVYRERADVIGVDEVAKPRWAYSHLGHEPHGYRITGRGMLADLERERLQPLDDEGGRHPNPGQGGGSSR